MQIINSKQGSQEWHEARCGIITASEISSVLAKGQGKTRATYMNKLIAECITGDAAHNYYNAHMQRGNDEESAAKTIYADGEIEQIGFIRNHDDLGGVGYSPDGRVDGILVEVKTRLPHLQVELLLADRIPPEHQAQIQTGLWVAGEDVMDFISYCPGLPLFKSKAYRDDTYIAAMREEVCRFYEELNQKLEQIKIIGAR